MPVGPLTSSEQARLRRLATAKRNATALLAAVTVVFLAVTVLGGDATWVGYVQATALASMAGGLADWFAVTALFRRPLGLPIPHTAIVVERKEQFAATLGEFIQESFLTPELILERARAARLVPRLADWLADPANAAKVAAELSNAAVGIADALRDEDVHRVLEQVVRERVESVPLAPLAGRGLRFLTKDGRHHEALDVALRALDRYVDEHRDELRRGLAGGGKSPWWLPGAVEDRIFERLMNGIRSVLQDMAGDQQHRLRLQFEARLAQLATDLETSPALRERGEQLKRELLDQPQLREWIASVWQDIKGQLRSQASDPDSELRRRIAGGIAAAGRRLRQDEVLAAKVQQGIEAGLCYTVERFDGEIASLVSGTIARWDASETALRLELLLGPDLQFVRINGTLVGAAAGLVLHLVAQAVA